MKNKKQSARLSLSKSTLVNLSHRQLQLQRGGGTNQLTLTHQQFTDSCPQHTDGQGCDSIDFVCQYLSVGILCPPTGDCVTFNRC